MILTKYRACATMRSMFLLIAMSAAVAQEPPQCSARTIRSGPPGQCIARDLGNYELDFLYSFEEALVSSIERRMKEEEQKRRQEERKRQKEEEQKRKQEAAASRREAEKLQRERAEQKQKQKQQQQRQKGADPGGKSKDFCPYKVLGVAMDATQAEIKKSYRALALKYHPDKVKDCDQQCHDRFAELVSAYELLSDEERRAMHDNAEFGGYQTRPPNFDSKAGFYGSTSLVIPLNQTEFNRLVLCQGPFGDDESCTPWMIKFYAPWCVHCKNLIPVWKRAASMLDGIETPLGFVRFAAVNCEADKHLCQRQSLSHFPSLSLHVRDANGQEHIERFPRGRERTAENFVRHAEMGVRLASEATLRPINRTVMASHVTNAEREGLWVVMFEVARSASSAAGALKAALRRMSANMRQGAEEDLVNFGVLDCGREQELCTEQHVDARRHPVLRLYPYKGAKGTGETLVEGGQDPLAVLPVVEKVIRMCMARVTAESALIPPLHEPQPEDPPPPPPPRFDYPQPERPATVHRALPAGTRATAKQQFIGK